MYVQLDGPTMRLEIGDKLQASRGLYYHYGIYVGHCGPYGEDVVHNDKDGGVRLVHWETFAAAQPVEVVWRAPSWYAGWMVRGRAVSLLGKQYDLLNFNCEHLANYAQSGAPASPQLAGIVVLSIVGALALAAISR